MARQLHNGKYVVAKLIKWQILVALSGSVIWFVNGNWHAMMSALSGGVVSIIANIVFSKMMFAHVGARSAKKIVKAFYLGEAVKILITASLFFLAIVALNSQLLPMITVFLLTQMVVVSGLFIKRCK